MAYMHQKKGHENYVKTSKERSIAVVSNINDNIRSNRKQQNLENKSMKENRYFKK